MIPEILVLVSYYYRMNKDYENVNKIVNKNIKIS